MSAMDGRVVHHDWVRLISESEGLVDMVLWTDWTGDGPGGVFSEAVLCLGGSHPFVFGTEDPPTHCRYPIDR